jgi:hypothetical protein
VSIEAITWALAQPIKQSSTKFVLVVLANCASADTMMAFPSIAYLADATGQDRKTVLTNLVRLRDCGLIEDTGLRRGETKQIVVYKLRGADMLEQFRNWNSSKIGTVPKTTGKSTNFPPKEAQKRDTEPSEPSERKSEKKAAAAALDITLPAWIKPEVWEGFVEMRKRERHPLTKRAAELVIKKLDAMTGNNEDPNESLDQSTRNGWRDVYSPRRGATNEDNRNNRESLCDRAARVNRQHDAREAVAPRSTAPGSTAPNLGADDRDIRSKVDEPHGRVSTGR